MRYLTLKLRSTFFLAVAALTVSSAVVASTYSFRVSAPGITPAVVSAPAIPANCRRDSAHQVWCVAASVPLSTSGAQVCGYPSNYSGTYYAVTAAAATAWGYTIGGGSDCATNYLAGTSQVRVSSLSCWTNQQRWARTGADSGSSVFVRCTSYE